MKSPCLPMMENPGSAVVVPQPIPVPSSPKVESNTPLSAREKRAANPLFAQTWSLSALHPQLPLLFIVDPNAPHSPKTRYRSHYCYLGPEPLFDQERRKAMSDFEVALHLIDFSALEGSLAQIYQPSAKGQAPFHPVSMFLAVCLRIDTGMSWRKVASALAGENGAGWRRLFGFDEGCTPCASGLRYFFQKTDPALFAELGPRWAEMLRAARLFPLHSTYPGDPSDQGVTMTQDGMLHQARSRPSCQLATDECYEPVMESGAEPSQQLEPVQAPNDSAGSSVPRRRCRARQKGREGCLCDGESCHQRCRRASHLDPEARFIHYEGRNCKIALPDTVKEEGKGEEGGKGRNVFGYRSVANRVLDDRWAVAWTLSSDLYPANTDEATLFLEGLAWLALQMPWMEIGEWLDDSAVGFEQCLKAIWSLGALRMVDIRADKGDSDFEVCLKRGYDGRGYPLCAHGYVMHPNGYDRERRRTKWVCNQLCRREARREGEPVLPPSGCPYLDPSRPLGQVRNVGLAFPNGSVRLAREIPYGSQAWKARYGRRNLSESRNGQMEGLQLKRMRSYGLERCRKDVQLADLLINLRTLGRLAREASDLYRD